MAQAGRIERVCQVCESVNQPSVCVTCVKNSVVERKRLLKKAVQQRDLLRERLEAKLNVKDESELQRRWKAEHAEHRKSLLEQIRSAKEELARSKLKLEQGQQQLREKQSQLFDANKQLASKRKELLGQYFPDLLKAQALGHTVISAELVRVRRILLRQVRTILPIKLAVVLVPKSWDGVRPLNQAVLICGVRLPDGDDVSTIPGIEVSASLGYLVQAVNLVAKYLCSPILHSGGYALHKHSISGCSHMLPRGSSSRVWQRTSYWDPRPFSRSSEYPLFLPRLGPSGMGITEDGGSSSSANTSAAGAENMQPAKPPGRPGGSTGPEGLGGIGVGGSPRGGAGAAGSSPAGVGVGGSSSAGTGAGGNSPAGAGNHVDGATRKEVRKGLQLLRRSISCMLAYEYAVSGWQPPPNLPIFAQLAVLLSRLTREPRSQGLSSSRTAEQSVLGNKSRGWGSGSFMDYTSLLRRPEQRLANSQMEASMSRGIADDYDEDLDIDDVSRYDEEGRDKERQDDDAFEGWDLIERPSLPPPPSRSEDVEHWTRAMFLDAR